MEKSAHKLELLRRIAELEEKALWHLDVEDDPETFPLMPDKVDYLNEKLINKIKNKIANRAATGFFEKMIKNLNKKSFNESDLLSCPHVVIHGIKQRVHYKWDIDGFLHSK